MHKTLTGSSTALTLSLAVEVFKSNDEENDKAKFL